QHAAVDLAAGSLLTTSSMQAALPLDPGTSIVGIAVSTAQVPATGLRAGDRVRLVSTPVAQGEPPTEPPPTIDAVVFATRPDDRTGGLVVDVVVPDSIAAEVAARAATGRLAIVLDGSTGPDEA
ncbi:MAG: SAF domain-containing protein, partial [Pseudoclavibacter sp.]